MFKILKNVPFGTSHFLKIQENRIWFVINKLSSFLGVYEVQSTSGSLNKK